MKNSTLILVVGSTASGKTDVAYKLARHLNTEIVSADARQVYRELKIGVNKPPESYLRDVPHHFIGTVSVFQEYNAGIYGDECWQTLNRLFKRYTVVVMAGGSGLYIKAALWGLDPIPPVPASLRAYLNYLLATRGLSYLQDMLTHLDKNAPSLIEMNNPARVVRALEVTIHTGTPFTCYWKGTPRRTLPFRTVWIGLEVPRPILYRRIDQRVDTMVKQGLVEEAREWYPHRHLRALRTHGYQEFFPYFEGRYPLEEAIRLVKRNTRHYAKRQYTWFKRYPAVWVSPEEAVQKVLTLIEEQM